LSRARRFANLFARCTPGSQFQQTNGSVVINEILELYEFNRWANLRMLSAVSALSEAQFTRELNSSFSSVRDTLVHMVGADWTWLSRWLGTSPAELPAGWSLETLADITQRWAEIEEERSAFLNGLTPDDLNRVITYRTLKGEPFANPFWQLLRHVVNHATYHRGQVTTLLRQLGMPALPTDLVLYYRLNAVPASAGSA
jgi:uncharacterized damage-inducible protein DinB